MIDQDVKKFWLRALLTNNCEPRSSSELKQLAQNGFSVSFTSGDLDQYLRELEEVNLIAGTDDPLSGKLWALTNKGKIRAQAMLKT